MPPAAEAIGVPARAAKSSPAWKACEWANGSMRLPNDDVSSAPAIGSRVGKRIKRERLLGGGVRDRRDLLLDPAELRVERAESAALAALPAAAARRLAPVGASGVRLAAAARRARPRRRVGLQHADPLAQLRRLALEPEQARRDRADLLERERQRERLGRVAARRRHAASDVQSASQ